MTEDPENGELQLLENKSTSGSS